MGGDVAASASTISGGASRISRLDGRGLVRLRRALRRCTDPSDAIAANPGKSDRAIAADIGVDHKTVARAQANWGIVPS
jgi:hypothetical protein